MCALFLWQHLLWSLVEFVMRARRGQCSAGGPGMQLEKQWLCSECQALGWDLTRSGGVHSHCEDRQALSASMCTLYSAGDSVSGKHDSCNSQKTRHLLENEIKQLSQDLFLNISPGQRVCKLLILKLKWLYFSTVNLICICWFKNSDSELGYSSVGKLQVDVHSQV